MQITCEICKLGIDSKPIAKYKTYSLYHCKTCDTMFWYPMESMLAETYGADDLAGALSYLNLRSAPWAHGQFFINPPAKGAELLEIGCSTGEFLDRARGSGYSVTGIDSAKETVEFARSHFGIQEVYASTIQEFIGRNPAHKFDVIAFFQVLEHVNDVPDFMQSVILQLKPDGFLSISVPNRDRWRFHSERFFMEKWDLPPSHITRWNVKSLVNLLESHGFSILSAEAEPFKLFDNSWNNFISHKLGINPLAERFTRRAVGRAHYSSIKTSGNNLRKTLTTWAGRLYLKVFLPFLGLITLPLRIILMKQGLTIYVLVSRTKKGEG